MIATRTVSVVKLGGSLLEDPALRGRALAAVAERWGAGDRVILVHGGGKQIDRALAAAGIPRRVHAGLRVTDEATLEIVVAVLAGLVNKSLVAELTALGVPAAGISGADGFTLGAVPHPPVDGVALGRVGKIASSNPVLVRTLLDAEMMPVVASIAAGVDGGLWNVNADAAASAIASAHGAGRLVFLTDVEGLLDAEGRTVPRLRQGEVAEVLAGPTVGGGMLPKLAACAEALAGGVGSIRIAGPAAHAAALAGAPGGTSLVRG